MFNRAEHMGDIIIILSIKLFSILVDVNHTVGQAQQQFLLKLKFTAHTKCLTFLWKLIKLT